MAHENIHPGAFIHPSSYADEGCRIGDGVKIWHFCHVMVGASVGAGCILGQNVFVGKDARLGKGVKVQNNVSVYTGVECEDQVFLGPSMVFTNVRNPRSEIERKDEFGKTLVRKGATIGANATILCGITIGRYAFIGAGAVVLRDVQDFELLTGNPAKHTGWMSKEGHRLHFSNGLAKCPATNEKYFLRNETVFSEND